MKPKTIAKWGKRTSVADLPQCRGMWRSPWACRPRRTGLAQPRGNTGGGRPQEHRADGGPARASTSVTTTGEGHAAWLARISPPRPPLHRSMRVAAYRTGDNSPLSRARHATHPSACRSRNPATVRSPRSDLSGMSPTPSPRSEPTPKLLLPADCHVALAANVSTQNSDL